MKLRTNINLEFTRENVIKVLWCGAKPDESPYTHQQIANWCESFWNKYCDIDAPEEIEKIMPLLADVETQWDLFLANTYSTKQLRANDFKDVSLPVEWFQKWLQQLNA